MPPGSQPHNNQYTIQVLLEETYAYLTAIERETKGLMQEEKLRPITEAKDAVKEMISQGGELNQKIIENYENKLAQARQQAKNIEWSSLPRPD